jgi:DNA-binding SARP family transcriptional activator
VVAPQVATRKALTDAVSGAAGKRHTALRLSVLNGFELRVGEAVLVVPANVERVLAFLAVRERPQLRSTVAATLWMDTTDDRAAASLRTALWKTRHAHEDCVVVMGTYLALGPFIEVDLAKLIDQARRLLAANDELYEADTDTDTLVGDLLPDWDEDWIVFERERLRQLRVHALEALCRRLTARGRHAEAINAGLAAVEAEPLRESAQRVLIGAHLAEGNICEARRQFRLYGRLLREDLGLEPSAGLRALVRLNAPEPTQS